MKNIDALFVPLNTNHVLIFKSIIENIRCSYNVVCFDRIAGSEKYHTENCLIKNKISFVHFKKSLKRSENENLLSKLINYFKLKTIILDIIEKLSPKVIVLAVDNDPISNLFMKLAIKKNIKNVIIQEGSARPNATINIKGIENQIIEIIRRLCGIQLSYTLHGTSMLYDKYIVAGKSSKEILVKRGVLPEKIIIVGQPKYDRFMEEAKYLRDIKRDSKTLLFAAGFDVIKNQENIDFLRSLVKTSMMLELKLIIKLHPRSSIDEDDIAAKINDMNISHCEIIKHGDDTINLLKNSYGLITVASTVITEALILGCEGILVDYLAKDEKLPYQQYGAVHIIENYKDVHKRINESISKPKPFKYKKVLLEDMLFRLDGKASERAAKVIEDLGIINQ